MTQASGIAASMDKVRADWNMSRESRFVRRRAGLPSMGASADWHYRNEFAYYADIEKSRDMDRNDSIVGQTVDRAVANIVQDGFVLDCKTGNKSLNRDLKARFLHWASDPEACDIAGEMTFHDFETQSCRGMMIDGDCVNLAIHGGSLQHLEAHLIRDNSNKPNTFLGVTKNQDGRRLHYWVQTEPVDPSHQNGSRGESRPVMVRNDFGHRILFHVYRPRRASQTRGVTAFAPIFELTGMFEDIQFAKLVQQQVVSCFAVFRKRNYIPDIPGQPPKGYGAASKEKTADGTRAIENITPGMEIVGDYGEELEGFSPNVPNAEYFSHVRLMMQMIGVNLGLPLCLVLMDGSETNFSGWRGAIDEARKGFRANQRMLVERFHKPLYRWKVSQWLAEDPALRNAAKKSRVDIYAHKWNVPKWAYINPVEDAQGDTLVLQGGLNSRRRLHGERDGAEWEELSSEIIEDNALAIEGAMKKAKAINSKNQGGTPVHWRELINLPMPTGVQMTMQDPNVIELQTEQAKQKLQTEASRV
ncbi:MAG: phage portal protein [Planctomycetota bacterium]